MNTHIKAAFYALLKSTLFIADPSSERGRPYGEVDGGRRWNVVLLADSSPRGCWVLDARSHPTLLLFPGPA